MKTIKIFLASSEELKDERKELADLVEHLNFTLGKQDMNIQLVKWEYLDSSMGPLHKQEEYNRELRDCELCMVLYWTRFGMYTKTELDTAYSELCAGNNPKKLYVYFKDGDEISSDLKEFRDCFPEQYGHFYCHFQNIDTLKADFLLQFMEYLNVYLKDRNVIEIKDSQVSINGKVYVNLQNVPFAGNNEEYNLLLKSIKKTKKILAVTEEDDPEYAEYAAELKELEEKQSQMESSLWDTALMVTRLSTTKCSERLQRAMDLFGKGDNKGAQAILNEEEIEKDVKHNLHLIELGEEGKKGLQTNIDEFLLKIKTLKNDKPEGWIENVKALYARCLELERDYFRKEKYAERLSDYGDFLAFQSQYDEVEEKYLTSNKILRALNGKGEYDYLILWNLRQLASYYMISLNYQGAESVLEETLEISKNQNSVMEVADTENYLAYLYFAQQEYDRAEELFTDVIRLAGDEPDDDFKTIIEYSHYYLALLYKDTYKYDLSIKEAEIALDVHDSLSENGERAQDMFVCNVYEALGNSYDYLGRMDEAEGMLVKGLEIVRKFAESNPEAHELHLLCCLGNLSRIHKFKNNYALSIEEASEAYEISKRLFNKYPLQYSAYYTQTLRDLAYLFKETKQYDKAVFTAKNALPAYDILLSTDAQRYRINKENILNLLGCTYLECGKYDEAAEMLNAALAFTKEIVSSSDLDYSGNIAQVLTNLGYLETKRGNYDAAEKYLLEANEVHMSEPLGVLPEDNSDLALLELNIGYLYECKKDVDKAAQWYIQSLERFRNLKTIRDAAQCKTLKIKDLMNLAGVYSHKKEMEQAERYSAEAKALCEELYNDSPDVYRETYARTLNELAWKMYCNNKSSDASQYAELSLEIAKEIGDKERIRMTLDTKACIDRSLGKYSEAEEEFLEAIDICEQLFRDKGGNLSKLAYEQKEIAKLYSVTGNHEKCKQYCEKSKSNYDKLTPELRQGCNIDIEELHDMLANG